MLSFLVGIMIGMVLGAIYYDVFQDVVKPKMHDLFIRVKRLFSQE